MMSHEDMECAQHVLALDEPERALTRIKTPKGCTVDVPHYVHLSWDLIINNNRSTIMRDTPVDIFLGHGDISSQDATSHFKEDGTWLLVNLSEMGTFVNGQIMGQGERRIIKMDDTLQFSKNTYFKYSFAMFPAVSHEENPNFMTLPGVQDARATLRSLESEKRIVLREYATVWENFENCHQMLQTLQASNQKLLAKLKRNQSERQAVEADYSVASTKMINLIERMRSLRLSLEAECEYLANKSSPLADGVLATYRGQSNVVEGFLQSWTAQVREQRQGAINADQDNREDVVHPLQVFNVRRSPFPGEIIISSSPDPYPEHS
ncbi:hypothetical protein QAD02_018414 [Eretmocerus hayati]|uniref:Uncharacterized protein n=1 Tax=Eretmocerus hayati TaxID=131215 RepID=A0ACC2PGN1_9HYME|nr:hypothetical protein QAD02_018414 [Eretmocerus hayati]